jgi:hypothetical protein
MSVRATQPYRHGSLQQSSFSLSRPMIGNGKNENNHFAQCRIGASCTIYGHSAAPPIFHW